MRDVADACVHAGLTISITSHQQQHGSSITEALEAFLVGHKIDVYAAATGAARSGRIERYDPRTDKHLVAFEPEVEEEEEEEEEAEGKEGTGAKAKAEVEDGKTPAPAPAPVLERRWITLRVRVRIRL